MLQTFQKGPLRHMQAVSTERRVQRAWRTKCRGRDPVECSRNSRSLGSSAELSSQDKIKKAYLQKEAKGLPGVFADRGNPVGCLMLWRLLKRRYLLIPSRGVCVCVGLE